MLAYPGLDSLSLVHCVPLQTGNSPRCLCPLCTYRQQSVIWVPSPREKGRLWMIYEVKGISSDTATISPAQRRLYILHRLRGMQQHYASITGEVPSASWVNTARQRRFSKYILCIMWTCGILYYSDYSITQGMTSRSKEQVRAFDKRFNISRRSVDEAEEIPSLRRWKPLELGRRTELKYSFLHWSTTEISIEMWIKHVCDRGGRQKLGFYSTVNRIFGNTVQRKCEWIGFPADW